MTTYVVSDLHVGSPFFRHDAFMEFLDGLPDGASLVVNGDLIDRHTTSLEGPHLRVLKRLCEEVHKRNVVFVRGNHESVLNVGLPPEVTFRDSHMIDRQLLVMHGHIFHNVRPYHRLFQRVFSVMHRLYVWVTGDEAHVAEFAKRFGVLYRVLRDSVAGNAIEYAREKGCTAITCGHTHYAEERAQDGIRYVNTGAWTETPCHYASYSDGKLKLVAFA